MNYAAILWTAAAASLLSVVLSASLISQHLQTWTRPAQQRNVVRIVFLAPLFAIDSLVGLLELDRGETVAHVLDMIKECYEAVAIHAFLMLMYDVVGLTPDHIAGKSSLPDGVKGRDLHVPFPLGLLFKHPRCDPTWIRRLRRWTLQFVVLRPVLSLADLILIDLLPCGASRITNIVIIIALNVSVTTAFFALITFYHAFEKELAPRRPLAKFLCIKGVVFFATWQGLVLRLLAHFDVLHEGHRFSIDEVQLAWQDLLVCLEMGLMFGPLHLYAFPPAEYDPKATVGGKTELEMKKVK